MDFENNNDGALQRELEMMILEDMEEWLREKLLEGQDMYDYLSDIEEMYGNDARRNALHSLTETYWRDHIFPV